MDEEYVVTFTFNFNTRTGNTIRYCLLSSSKTVTTKIALQNYQIVKPYCQIKIAKCLNVRLDGQADRLIYVSLPALFGCLSDFRVRPELRSDKTIMRDAMCTENCDTTEMNTKYG